MCVWSLIACASGICDGHHNATGLQLALCDPVSIWLHQALTGETSVTLTTEGLPLLHLIDYCALRQSKLGSCCVRAARCSVVADGRLFRTWGQCGRQLTHKQCSRCAMGAWCSVNEQCIGSWDLIAPRKAERPRQGLLWINVYSL